MTEDVALLVRSYHVAYERHKLDLVRLETRELSLRDELEEVEQMMGSLETIRNSLESPLSQWKLIADRAKTKVSTVATLLQNLIRLVDGDVDAKEFIKVAEELTDIWNASASPIGDNAKLGFVFKKIGDTVRESRLRSFQTFR